MKTVSQYFAMILAAAVVLGLVFLCGCAGRPDVPSAPAKVEVNAKGEMTVTPAQATLHPTKVIVVSGGSTKTYIPAEDLGIPWVDIGGIALVTLAGGAIVWFFFKSKNMAMAIVFLGGAGIGGIVFWEIRWFVLGAVILMVAAWLFLPRLKETLGVKK